ncbi:MAG: hypothetical protein D6812_11950 [Deltaproteobacteria bacterium]|nr:MAG: hypothetical protein D6812_11950 [Deltaproteobacteria bacterium]
MHQGRASLPSSADRSPASEEKRIIGIQPGYSPERGSTQEMWTFRQKLRNIGRKSTSEKKDCQNWEIVP